MRIEGENWEDSIYPLLLGASGRRARSLLPENALVSAAATWLRLGGSILTTPYFNSVRQAGSAVLPAASLPSFLRDHLRFIVRFYLEMSEMIEWPREAIKARLLARRSLHFAGLRDALLSGRGILMPTIQTTVFLRTIFSDFPQARYNLVLHRQYPEILRILEKADPSWNFLFLEDAPAHRIMTALSRGEVVVCNIDHAYPGSEVTLAPVLGEMGIVPSGAFRLAQRSNALIVPLCLMEAGSEIVMVADQVFDWHDREPLSIARMLERFHPILDKAVLQGPERWFGWGNLVNRWQAWRDLVHEPN
jgi:hypothetical protein